MQQYPARQSESLLYKCNYGGRVSARQCKVTWIYSLCVLCVFLVSFITFLMNNILSADIVIRIRFFSDAGHVALREKCLVGQVSPTSWWANRLIEARITFKNLKLTLRLTSMISFNKHAHESMAMCAILAIFAILGHFGSFGVFWQFGLSRPSWLLWTVWTS